MIKTDFHTHTRFSFDILDIGYSPDDMITSAIEKGLDTIILTDHLEVNSEVEGLYAPFDFEGRREACLAAREKAKGIKVGIGIELGQPEQYPQKAYEFLRYGGYEFVLGSLHNLKNTPDFSVLDYSDHTPEDYYTLWDMYLDEYSKLIDIDGIDTFTHMTYPLRYFARNGNFYPDITRYEDKLMRVLEKIISKGKCMEINTAGHRHEMAKPLPDEYIVSLYASLGGKMVTVGSDAHLTKDVASHFDIAESLVKKYDLEIKEF